MISTRTAWGPAATLLRANPKRWARENRACWELTAHYEQRHHTRIQTGFDLTLFARRPAACAGDPGCAACGEVREGLLELALQALPPQSRYEVEPFDAAFHLRPENNWRPELRLVVQVLHHDGTFEPPDGEERGQTRTVEGTLARLGLHRRVWPER